MKTKIQFSLLFTVLAILALNTPIHAQSGINKKNSYKELVVDNPTAEADMKVAADFSNAIAEGDAAAMRRLLSDKAMMHGPSPVDSSTGEQYIKSWVEGGFKTSTNRKVSFIQQTFKVTQGNLAGKWVSQWGDYSFTQNGKTVKFPYQSTMLVENGKIVMSRIYYDNMYILSQLGFKMIPPDAVAKE